MQVRGGVRGRFVRFGFAEGGDDGSGGGDIACDSGRGLLCSGVDGRRVRDSGDGEFGGDGFGGSEELCFVGDGGGDGGGVF